jgi:GNAT superfamily N-acetyltransferase
LKEHRGTGLSLLMLRRVVQQIIENMAKERRPLSEINVTTETDNFGALKMYRTVGFRENYAYTQAYLPISE